MIGNYNLLWFFIGLFQNLNPFSNSLYLNYCNEANTVYLQSQIAHYGYVSISFSKTYNIHLKRLFFLKNKNPIGKIILCFNLYSAILYICFSLSSFRWLLFFLVGKRDTCFFIIALISSIFFTSLFPWYSFHSFLESQWLPVLIRTGFFILNNDFLIFPPYRVSNCF